MPLRKDVKGFGMPWDNQYGYAQAVRVDDTIYVSGQLSHDGPENMVSAGALVLPGWSLNLPLAPPGRRGNRHLARNPNLKARKEFLRECYLDAARPAFMLRVVSRLVRPEFLVVTEIVAAKP